MHWGCALTSIMDKLSPRFISSRMAKKSSSWVVVCLSFVHSKPSRPHHSHLLASLPSPCGSCPSTISAPPASSSFERFRLAVTLSTTTTTTNPHSSTTLSPLVRWDTEHCACWIGLHFGSSAVSTIHHTAREATLPDLTLRRSNDSSICPP